MTLVNAMYTQEISPEIVLMCSAYLLCLDAVMLVMTSENTQMKAIRLLMKI